MTFYPWGTWSLNADSATFKNPMTFDFEVV